MDPKTNVRYLTRVIPNGEIRYIFINMIMKSDLLMGMPEYYLKPNREGGFGRSGPMVILVSRRKEAFIFEFKKAQDIDNLEEKADEALAQIEEQNYRSELRDMGYKITSRYGISFCGKDCLVKWAE